MSVLMSVFEEGDSIMQLRPDGYSTASSAGLFLLLGRRSDQIGREFAFNTSSHDDNYMEPSELVEISIPWIGLMKGYIAY